MSGKLFLRLGSEQYTIVEALETYGGVYPIEPVEHREFMIPAQALAACRISEEGEHTIYVAVPGSNSTTADEAEVSVLRGQFSQLDDIEETELDWEPVDYKQAPSTGEQVFVVVEQMPQYPGGEKAMKQYIVQHVQYPKEALDNGISGVVYVTFVVEKDGSIGGTKILRGIGGGCDEEALRVVSSMPNWTPGMQRGVPVRTQYNIPIRFAK